MNLRCKIIAPVLYSRGKPQEFIPGEAYYPTDARQSEGDHRQKISLPFALEEDQPTRRYVQSGMGHSSGGAMTTSSGLVFVRNGAQLFKAVDAQTGQRLWHFNTGQTIHRGVARSTKNSTWRLPLEAPSSVSRFPSDLIFETRISKEESTCSQHLPLGGDLQGVLQR
jgi:hypothetical protein